MEYKRSVLFTILAFIVVLVNCDEYSSSKSNGAYNRQGPKTCPYCNTLSPPKRGTPGTQSCCDNSSKGVESVELVGQGGRSVYVNPNNPARCCRGVVRNYFKTDLFENIFSNRNSLEVEDHANKGFLDYQSFITASALYQPYGFGTTYMNWTLFGTKEVAAFLAHVSTKVSCGNKLATMDQLAWGSCYNKEMNSNSNYCDEHYQKAYPCAPEVAYFGCGALPIYWNYNYGKAGKDLKVDLLNHPEYIEQNATLAFQVAIWRWMMPIKKHQPTTTKCIFSDEN